jgi:hypothetical protein
MKQTAIEWLIEKLDQNFDYVADTLIKQAKEMEEEQIINAFKEGNLYHGWALKHEPEQYYNETYKNETK